MKMHERTEVKSVRDLVLLWGDPPSVAYEKLADEVGGIEWSAVRDWARRGRIPAQHIDAVVNAAQRRGFHDVTHAFVLKIRAREVAASN